MKRDLLELARGTYDVAIIGGGISGACLAWDAALRGLSVVLVEKDDFGQATSANTLRVIHGGLRYLQYGDFGRARDSARERTTWMRIAPHRVRPLPVLVPTYGHLARGPEVFRVALAVHDLLGSTWGRTSHAIPHARSRVVSRRECLALAPGIPEKGLTGGALWHDGQIDNSERLILSVLTSAVHAGAVIANYVKAIALLQRGGRVRGIRVRDGLMGADFDILARIVVNASGPWVGQIAQLHAGDSAVRRVPLAKAFNLITRRIGGDYALGLLPVRTGRGRGTRAGGLLFVTPWHGHSLVGTMYAPYHGPPDECTVTTSEIAQFVENVNEAFPPARLEVTDVGRLLVGLVPFDGVDSNGAVRPERRYQIYDHSREDRVDGLISVIALKFTEARHVAERVVDLVMVKLGRQAPACRTAGTAVHGGGVDPARISDKLGEAARLVDGATVQHLIRGYGSACSDVLRYVAQRPETARPVIERSPVIMAEIVHGIRDEMAQRLSDVILRRTELGHLGFPGRDAVRVCAEFMAEELGWPRHRTEQEVNDVVAVFSPLVGHG